MPEAIQLRLYEPPCGKRLGREFLHQHISLRRLAEDIVGGEVRFLPDPRRGRGGQQYHLGCTAGLRRSVFVAVPNHLKKLAICSIPIVKAPEPIRRTIDPEEDTTIPKYPWGQRS